MDSCIRSRPSSSGQDWRRAYGRSAAGVSQTSQYFEMSRRSNSAGLLGANSNNRSSERGSGSISSPATNPRRSRISLLRSAHAGHDQEIRAASASAQPPSREWLRRKPSGGHRLIAPFLSRRKLLKSTLAGRSRRPAPRAGQEQCLGGGTVAALALSDLRALRRARRRARASA